MPSLESQYLPSVPTNANMTEYVCTEDWQIWKYLCMKIFGIKISLENQINPTREFVVLRPKFSKNNVFKGVRC